MRPFDKHIHNAVITKMKKTYPSSHKLNLLWLWVRMRNVSANYCLSTSKPQVLNATLTVH